MGRLAHSAFYVEWERLLLEHEEADIQVPDANTLFRKYVGKLAPELRSRILSNTWVLDGGPTKAVYLARSCGMCSSGA